MNTEPPHCPDFKPSPLAAWLCAWWESEATDKGVEYFCSRPDWEERICETQGKRNHPEQALSGPVGINVARLMGIELPEIGEHPNSGSEVRLAQNVAEHDTGGEGK